MKEYTIYQKIFPINLNFYIDKSKYLTVFTATLKVYNEYQNNTGDFCKTRRLKSKVLTQVGSQKLQSQINYPTKTEFFILKNYSKNQVNAEARIKFPENLRNYSVTYYDSY